jgi:hypothetical protein
MSPRYKPKAQAGITMAPPQPPSGEQPADVRAAEREMLRAAARSAVDAESSDPYSLMRGEHLTAFDGADYVDLGQPRGRVSSYWFDLVLQAESERRALASMERWPPTGDQGDPDDPTADHELPRARQRLAMARKFSGIELGRRAQRAREHPRGELRDLTVSGLSPFSPSAGPPLFLADAFAAAARARAGLADALPKRPMPAQGDHIEVPRLATGAAVAVVATENATVSEVDPTSALASSSKCLVAGQVDVSRQLLEFSKPGIDEVLAVDLGNDQGLKVDQQLISGTNANGQTAWLANVSGANAITYTSGTPTAAALVSKIWSAYQAIADSGGGPSEPGEANYVIVVAPRRAAAIGADQGQTSATPVLPGLPGRLVVTSGIRQNLGASTSEDEVFVVARNEVFVCLSPPVFQVFPEVGSSTLTVRLQARQYVAAMFSRQPKSIARISGTGLVTPVL